MNLLVEFLEYQFLILFFEFFWFFFFISNLLLFCYFIHFHCSLLFWFFIFFYFSSSSSAPSLLVYFPLLSSSPLLSVSTAITFSSLVSTAYYTLLDILSCSLLLFSNKFQNCGKLATVFLKLCFTSALQSHQSLFFSYVSGNKYLLLSYVQ